MRSIADIHSVAPVRRVTFFAPLQAAGLYKTILLTITKRSPYRETHKFLYQLHVL